LLSYKYRQKVPVLYGDYHHIEYEMGSQGEQSIYMAESLYIVGFGKGYHLCVNLWIMLITFYGVLKHQRKKL